MTRKQHKHILNYAARQIGRKAAKLQYGKRDEFARIRLAFYHKPTLNFFLLREAS